MASLGILVFLVIVLVEVLSAAIDRLLNGGTPRVFPEGIGIMAVTLVVNLFVVSYELRAGRRLQQRGAARRREAHAQRRADVRRRARRADRRVAGATRSSIRWPRCSWPASSATPCWEIAQEASRILGGRDRDRRGRRARRACAAVPEVLGCEKIRTRGSADYAFLDLHLWLDRRHAAARRRTPRRTSSRTG